MEDTNYKDVQKVLIFILIANIIVAISKILIGSLIKSSSMSADGFHSMSDGASNIVAIIGIYFASKPADDEHPYGHNKIEIITGLIIAVFLVVVGFNVLSESIQKIKNPIMPSISKESIAVLTATLIVNIFVTLYEHKMGLKLNSNILISDANHTKSDIFVTIGVLFTLLGVKLGLPVILDSIVSLIVAGVIFFTAWEVFSENGNILIDKKIIDENMIIETISSMEYVKNIHKIRSRGTKNNIFIDMHIMVKSGISIEEGHRLSHEIEEKIQKEVDKNAHVLIHMEPYYEK